MSVSEALFVLCVILFQVGTVRRFWWLERRVQRLEAAQAGHTR